MKLKNSTIKDFAEALGETDELGEYRIEHYHKAIPKVSVRNNLREIFLPIFELKERFNQTPPKEVSLYVKNILKELNNKALSQNLET
ncbi:hypothetical protein YZ50_04855 [Campylobacter upsaliensis]|nr:hypothetical protein [Campylobacter upsaliensis]